jgi:hypothetical protein
LIRRVLDVDALTCPKCSVPMIIIAFISDPPVLRKILQHLELPSSAPAVLPAARSWDDAPPDEPPGWFPEDSQVPPASTRSSRDPPARM